MQVPDQRKPMTYSLRLYLASLGIVSCWAIIAFLVACLVASNLTPFSPLGDRGFIALVSAFIPLAAFSAAVLVSERCVSSGRQWAPAAQPPDVRPHED
jgi:hypothetical protein